MNLLLYSPCPRRIFTVNTRVYESGVQVQCHLRASKPSSCAENGQMLGTVTYTEKRRFLLVTRLLLLRPCNPTRTSLETAITSFHSPVANPPVVSYFIQIKFFPILKALLRQASANLSGLLTHIHFAAPEINKNIKERWLLIQMTPLARKHPHQAYIKMYHDSLTYTVKQAISSPHL